MDSIFLSSASIFLVCASYILSSLDTLDLVLFVTKALLYLRREIVILDVSFNNQERALIESRPECVIIFCIP